MRGNLNGHVRVRVGVGFFRKRSMSSGEGGGAEFELVRLYSLE